MILCALNLSVLEYLSDVTVCLVFVLSVVVDLLNELNQKEMERNDVSLHPLHISLKFVCSECQKI